MSDDANKVFADLLENLEIDVSVDSDGLYTVCSRSEPFFCYEGDSHHAVVQLSIRTIAAYAKKFLGIEEVNIQSQESELSKLPFDIERSKKVGSVHLIAA